MRLQKNHNIQLYVNGQLVDVESESSLNIRFNSVFPNPTSIESKSGEYSFSFTLPKTPKNQKIFGFANILSRPNKFIHNYSATLEVDGLLIFSGQIIINKINKEGYSCNLLINKQNTLENIFGDMTMNQLNWNVDYSGATSMNGANGWTTLKYGGKGYTFPLINYGCWQKSPNGENYTSKYLIDDSTRIYQENLYPSFNLLTLVKKLFESKGYDVQGDIFDDEVAQHIFTSTPLADEQNPTYNYGTDMGKCQLSFNYSNVYSDKNGTVRYSKPVAVPLDTPLYVNGRLDGSTHENWQYNNVYDCFNGENCEITESNFGNINKLIFRENRLVALESGWYKIGFNIRYEIDQNYRFKRKVTTKGNDRIITPNYGNEWTFEEFPTEFQLVKNSEDNLDVRMIAPNAIQDLTYLDFTIDKNENFTLTPKPNTKYDPSMICAYPHEADYEHMIEYGDDYLLFPQNGKTLQYDPRVNKNFIMGCCTSGEYTFTSVIKNGKSWDKDCLDEGKARYESAKYNQGAFPNSKDSATLSDKRENKLPNGTMLIQRGSGRENYPMDYMCQCDMAAIVYLEKNDSVQLKMLQRRWENPEARTNYDSSSDSDSNNNSLFEYQTSPVVFASGNIIWEMFAPSEKISVNSDKMDWNNESLFPTQLNLGNFLPSNEKVSDFINNFISEFNLSYSENDGVITLNKQVIDYDKKKSINLSDRVNEDEIEIERIDFPKNISVQYTINNEERGVYISAEKNATEDEMQSSNWTDYADKGYDIVEVDKNSNNEVKVQTKSSYCWYDNFKLTQDKQDKDYRLPIIAKDEWMIDGYKDAEMMKYDGHKYNRRYFFPKESIGHILLNNDPLTKVNVVEMSDKFEHLDYDGNVTKVTEMNYKFNTNNETLLTRFFNVYADTSSNYINFDCYLTTDEYIQLKKGANIVIDSDVYIPIEITGFDPSCDNKTKIKAMRK